MRTTNHRTVVLTAAALVLGAGTCWSSAFGADPPKSPSSDPAMHGDAHPPFVGEFHSSADLLSRSAANANGEVVGEIQDFIFDRGSGQIEYALVKSGDILGVGGRTIAVPYARLGYDAVNKRFLLDTTKEQVSREAEFVPENWRELNHTSWTEELDKMFSAPGADSARADDGVAPDRLVKAPEQRVKGTITGVQRTRTMLGAEQTVVSIRTDDGPTHEVLLGPSWYVMGMDAAPMRGEPIDVKARALAGDGPTKLVACSAKIDGTNVEYRDTSMTPKWHVPREASSTPTSESASASSDSGRLELLSDLVGSKARALDKDGGEVQNAIIERQSGRIAIIGFDPNENLLGLGDTIRCVPWSVVSVRSDNTVAIDATIDMLKSGLPMPDDASDLDAPTRLEPVYRAFQVDVERFKPISRHEASDGAASGAYGWLDAARHGKDTSLSGTVLSTQTNSVSPGEPAAQILAIKTGESTTRVVLGPAWYVDRQRLGLKPSDTVSVTGREVTIDGHHYVVARTVTCNGQTMKFWDGNEPAWASAN